MALGRGGDFESGCQVVSPAVGRNHRKAWAKRAVLEPRLEPRLQTGLRLRGCNVRTEAGEDLQPTFGAVVEILIGAEVCVRVHGRGNPKARHEADIDAAEA